MEKKNWNRLNQMLDEGIRGGVSESRYDETELSDWNASGSSFWKVLRFPGRIWKKKENIKSMISDISHQTKAPVANIRLYAELLGKVSRTARRRKLSGIWRHRIQSQAEKLDFLLQSLTKMSRLESDIVAVRPVCQRILPLLEHVKEEALLAAQKKEFS